MERALLATARRNIALYYAFIFLANFLLWAGVWIKYLIDDRGLELRWILAMDLPFWLLVSIFQAPMGALADRVGRKRILALSGALYTLTILGFGLTTNYWMLFADYVIWAFAMSAQTGADQALVYDTMKEAGIADRYQRVIGRAFALGLAAGLVGVVLGGLLASATSLSLTVQVSAFAPFLTIGVSLAMKEPAMVRAGERHYLGDLRRAMSFAWGAPQVRYTLLVGAVLLTGTFGPVVLVQPFLIHHDVETSLFGVYQAPLRLVSVAVAIGAAGIGAFLGMPRMLSLSCITILAAYGCLALFDVQPAFAFFALPAAVQGMTTPLLSAHLNERIPSDVRATVLSLMQLWFALQVAFFEPALGFFADGLSLTWAFVFAGAYFAATMPVLLLFWLRAHPAQRSRGGPIEAPSGSPAIGQ